MIDIFKELIDTSRGAAEKVVGVSTMELTGMQGRGGPARDWKVIVKNDIRVMGY